MGFFSAEELRKSNKTVDIGKKPLSCHSCGLLKGRITQVEPTGKGREGIAIIVPEPMSQSQVLGGPAGNYLKRCLKKLDIDLDRDCVIIPAVKCKPKDGLQPNNHQVQSCSKFLRTTIKRIQPFITLTFGYESLYSLIHGYDIGGALTIDRFRGYRIPDQDLKTWVCPLWHPSVPMKKRDAGDGAWDVLFQMDLKNALDLLDMPESEEDEYFNTDYHSMVFTETDPEKVIEVIQSYTDMPASAFVGFDYEGTGLKPQAEGHEIYSGSLCAGPSRADSFLLFSKNWSDAQLQAVTDAWVRFLKSPCRKMAHNAKFETTWSAEIFGCEPNNMYWCSMIAAHILRTTPLTKGLKFQAFVRYGLLPYNGDVGLLKTKSVNKNNGINDIHKIPVQNLLHYGGLDALMQWKLSMDQMQEIGYAS